MALHTRRRQTEARQIEIWIMEDNTETGVSFCNDPMPVSASSTLAVVYSHNAKAINRIPTVPALQLGPDPEELQRMLQLREIGGEGPLLASADAVVDKQLSHDPIRLA